MDNDSPTLCSVSTASDRLQRYYDAETRILTAGFSVRLDLRQRQEAELSEIRKAIAQLEAVVARENAAASGVGGGRFSQADFSGGCR